MVRKNPKSLELLQSSLRCSCALRRSGHDSQGMGGISIVHPGKPRQSHCCGVRINPA